MSQDALLSTAGLGDATCTLWLETNDVVKRSTMHRTALHNKNLSTPELSGYKIKKLL